MAVEARFRPRKVIYIQKSGRSVVSAHIYETHCTISSELRNLLPSVTGRDLYDALLVAGIVLVGSGSDLQYMKALAQLLGKQLSYTLTVLEEKI